MSQFKVVYADPAWQYGDKKPRGGAEHHYPTMSVADMCKLRVADIAADDSALFIWGTYPLIREALTVIDAWGFTYKTLAFQWVKLTKAGKPFLGLGRWTRGNTEPCWLAIRGKPERQSAAVRQLLIEGEGAAEEWPETVCAQRGRHSAKPPEVRNRIVELVGDVPRVELFARERVPGWHAWGNEVESTVRL